MTRKIATIFCFLAALLLIPIQAELSHAYECEEESEEVECYVVSCSESKTEEPEEIEKDLSPADQYFRNDRRFVRNAVKPVITMPVQILYCVFRE